MKIIDNKKVRRHIFHIQGMHCNACVLMTESEIGDLPHITYVRSSLADHSVEVEGDFGDRTLEEIALELTVPIKKHGYTIVVDRNEITNINLAKWSDFKIAIPLALAFVALFVILQKVGIVNLVNTGNVTYGTAFVIGIIASLSTCMAVVGGLVLSLSASFAKNPSLSEENAKDLRADKLKTQLMFHGGRIVSFFLLGGVIGALGAVFTLNTSATFILGLVIGIVMIILGLNLLDIFHFTKKLQPSMPKFIAKRAHGIAKLNHSLTPLLVGIATFFLPCGFTQSMQLYTLTTGNFLQGGLTMLAFALGTLPVLALISFSSFNIEKSQKAGIFFKTAGLVVIAFAIFNLINSLVVIGLLPPIFNL